jgi:hypothetical protein
MCCRWLSLIRSWGFGEGYVGKESEVVLLGETGKYVGGWAEVKGGFEARVWRVKVSVCACCERMWSVRCQCAGLCRLICTSRTFGALRLQRLGLEASVFYRPLRAQTRQT